MKNNKDIIISVRIDDELYEKLLAFMELSKESRSNVIRDAITTYVDVNNLFIALNKGGNNNA